MHTNEADQLFSGVISRAIEEVRVRGIGVFTFAFYHDHESEAVSVCVDTEANSARFVISQNAFSIKYFGKAIANGNLAEAALWQANVGRSLSLGDFELINLARTGVEGVRVDDGFYLSMIRALQAYERDIVRLAFDPLRLLFAASAANDEIGFLWHLRPRPDRGGLVVQ